MESIYDLDQERKVVRVKDIAKRMGVKMPSVSSMLKTLNRKGLVNYEKYEYVELTKAGTHVGKEMRHRHETLLRFLTDILKIDHTTADQEACQMEHALSTSTLNSLIDFMAFIRMCPRTGKSWLDHFEEYRLHGHSLEKCKNQSKDFACEFEERVHPQKTAGNDTDRHKKQASS